ncbi:MAG: hypothetical protein N4A33_01775 [Bacteriovoracaceae bacterium]|jgi:hypothetical protein|nr:hypothetical protein [Bacteriovoracaceae bacterium]
MKKLILGMIVLGCFSSFASSCYLKAKGGLLGLETQHYVDYQVIEDITLNQCLDQGFKVRDIIQAMHNNNKKVIVEFWEGDLSPSESEPTRTVIIKN